jgi:hypothetical protein
MSNPLVDQGSLDRLKASVVFDTAPELNVTAPYLGREGVRLALEGNATDYLPTMTGAVTSPAPYMMTTLTVNLLKSQPLSNVYKALMESNTLVGDCSVRPDVHSGLGIYQLLNCAVESVREMNFSGEEPVFAVTIRGYYNVNADFFGA